MRFPASIATDLVCVLAAALASACATTDDVSSVDTSTQDVQDVLDGTDIPGDVTGDEEDDAQDVEGDSATEDVAEDAVDATDVTSEDVLTEEPQGALGDPCTEHSDCDVGYCVETSTGERLCSGSCVDSCPEPYEDWECRLLRLGASTVVTLCLPPSDTLCAACFRDDQCETLADLCIEYPIGSFCARDCTYEECPLGYTCQDVDRDGTAYRQCLPDAGSCADCVDGDWDMHGTGTDCDGSDCDDTDPDVHEHADEVLDGVDNDCDTIIDEGTEAYDDDGDGYCETAPCAYGASGGGDCDDTDDTVYPGAAEDGGAGTNLADGLDNDCDGTEDESTLNYDDDGDGYCETAPCVYGVFGEGDCDDDDGSVHPGAAEVANGEDDDCDGDVDEGTDAYDDDGDGYCEAVTCADGSSPGDCDDGDDAIHPGAVEVVNGEDDDCDGAADEGTDAYDDDGDGYCETAPCTYGLGGGDCDDADDEQYPGATELRNGEDDDCDGTADEGTDAYDDDGDGYCEVAPCVYGASGGDDCDDTNALLNPGETEVPNGRDDDCDGTADEGTTAYDDDGDGYCEFAPCTVGASGGGDCDDADDTRYPGAAEVQNGEDDDCDGDVDEGTTAYDDDGDGYCEIAPCVVGASGGGDCDDADLTAYPGASIDCSMTDHDCNGFADQDNDGDGYLREACGGGDCNDEEGAVHPGAAEVRDGLDNDCSGLYDEGLINVGDIVITEIMQDPDTPLTDTVGEWFEVRNVTSTLINLQGWVLDDDDLDGHTISQSGGVPVPAGTAVVLARNGDPAQNGGITPAYQYDNFILANSGDEVVLLFEGTEIDRVNYTGSSPWPDPTGESMNLDPDFTTDSGNDSGGNWCQSTASEYHTGNRGTPGADNHQC